MVSIGSSSAFSTGSSSVGSFSSGEHGKGIDKTWTVDYELDCGQEPRLNYGPKVAQNHSEDSDSKILINKCKPNSSNNSSLC